jgi:prepilin-type N-terminal cleavage/methylation domain-containing protein
MFDLTVPCWRAVLADDVSGEFWGGVCVGPPASGRRDKRAMTTLGYRREDGFTMIELMVTIAVAAILVGIAVPSFQNYIQNTRSRALASDLSSALNLARAEAVTRADQVNVCPSDDGAACGGTWADGWVVIVVASGELLRTYPEPRGNGHDHADARGRHGDPFRPARPAPRWHHPAPCPGGRLPGQPGAPDRSRSRWARQHASGGLPVIRCFASRRQRGVGMIEVLISIVVVALGVLALARLQTTMIRSKP